MMQKKYFGCQLIEIILLQSSNSKMYWEGVYTLLAYFTLLIIIGIITGLKFRKLTFENLALSGRGDGILIGIISLTVNWTGGTLLLAVAESLAFKGLVNCQLIFTNSVNLLLGSFLLINGFRNSQWITILDPINHKFGRASTLVFYVILLLADVLLISSNLLALAQSSEVILDLDPVLCIVVGGVISVIYTSSGLYSVSSGDVVHFLVLIVGLILVTPFKYVNEPTNRILQPGKWIGIIKYGNIAEWVDLFLMLCFGNIPRQVYFQRIVSLKTNTTAYVVSAISCVLCFAVLLAAASYGIDYNIVETANSTLLAEDMNMIFPEVIKRFSRKWVTVFGLLVIYAGSLSAVSSTICGAGALLTNNLYKFIRPGAYDWEKKISLRVGGAIVCILSMILSFYTRNVYYLLFLSTELLYCTIVPHLLLAIHLPNVVNAYGSLPALGVGLGLRLLAGEEGINLPPVIEYPMMLEKHLAGRVSPQRFPFRTLGVLLSAFVLILVSGFAKFIFDSGIISNQRWDFLGAFTSPSSDETLSLREFQQTNSVPENIVFERCGSNKSSKRQKEMVIPKVEFPNRNWSVIRIPRDDPEKTSDSNNNSITDSLDSTLKLGSISESIDESRYFRKPAFMTSAENQNYYW